jgi:formylmethanofuran dehydrogenase subunit E
MGYKRCSECNLLFQEDKLLKRVDNSELVCPHCSGLLAREDLSCKYDETGCDP